MIGDDSVDVHALEHTRASVVVQVIPVGQHVKREPCFSLIPSRDGVCVYLSEESRGDPLYNSCWWQREGGVQRRPQRQPVEVWVLRSIRCNRPWTLDVLGHPLHRLSEACECILKIRSFRATSCCCLRLRVASACSSSVSGGCSGRPSEDDGVTWMGGGCGCPDAPGMISKPVRLDVDIPDRRSGILNKAARKLKSLPAERGDAAG